MQVLDPAFDPGGFFARVKAAPVRVLILDYDGTLAPFHPDPAQARPYPGIIGLLERLMTEGRTRVVLATGRWTRDILPLLPFRQAPEIWGSHGRERLGPEGGYEAVTIAPERLPVLVRADELFAGLEALGARLEQKPASLAVHWRDLPGVRVAEIRRQARERWATLQPEAEGWSLHDFDGGVELREDSCDKGRVVRTVAGEAGPSAALAYLGDDFTDEHAFRALPPAAAGVLVRPELRPTAAHLWLRPPEELRAFLQQWLTAGRRA